LLCYVQTHRYKADNDYQSGNGADDDIQSDVTRAVRRGGPNDGHGRESSYFQFSAEALFGEPRNDKF
jgi:hypothetical protein